MKTIFLIFFVVPFLANAQIITTVAGCGSCGTLGDGGPAISASIGYFAGIAISSRGDLYIADGNHNRVRKVDAITGMISTVAGNGTASYNGDNILATSAQLAPQFLAFDLIGNLYISDPTNRRIRKIDTFGIITTFAGNGSIGGTGDSSAAIIATLTTPQGLVFDAIGNLYMADVGLHKVRRVDTSGVITTVAGNGTPGFSGDSSMATLAELHSPTDVAIDKSGNLLIADHDNNRIRKIDHITNVITTVAGYSPGGYSGDGIPATSSWLAGPWGVATNANSFFIADYSNNRIRQVDTAGIIHTVAGIGIAGYMGDSGSADTAYIYHPEGIRFDKCGNMYIADYGNRRVRKVTYPPTLTTPAIFLSGTTTAAVGSTVTVNATVASAGSSYLAHWMNDGVEFSETTVPFVTYTKTAAVDTITARIVPTGYGCWDSTTSAGWVVTNSAETSPQPSPKERELSVFPNPVRDVLQVAVGSSSGQSYRLLNMIGGVIQQGALHSGKNMLQVQALPMGIYVLEVTDDKGGKMIKKIVKE